MISRIRIPFVSYYNQLSKKIGVDGTVLATDFIKFHSKHLVDRTLGNFS